jgi:tRNA(Ile)-lysidine synthase
MLTVPRATYAQPGGRALLAMAALCAGGGERPPRGDVVDRLADRLASETAFTATLAGARLEADPDEAVLFREPGETARSGLRPLRLVPERAAIWDGRFEITADEPGEIRAAKGLLARLSGEERKRLNDLPPAARGSAPVLIRDADLSPVLADRVARMRNLAQPRLKASCGLIAHEREITGLRVALKP